jgi:hypothetical protein
MAPRDGKRKTDRRQQADDRNDLTRSAKDRAIGWTEVGDDAGDFEDSNRRMTITPGEAEDYDEWREERRTRGRKRRSKRGGHHRRSRDDEDR